MKAAATTGPGRVEILDQPEPRAFGDLVVVKILVAPLCTEFKDRRAGHVSDAIGHEAAGVVVDAGSSTRVRTGDRVAVMPQYACGQCWLCQAGDHIYCPNQRDVLAQSGSTYGTATLAQYILKPDWLLIPVPADVSLRHAVMACCGFGPTFTAHRRIDSSSVDTVVVSGCGPVGLGGIVQGRYRGATMLALETHPYRMELAAALGAAQVIDPRDPGAIDEVRKVTDGRGAAAGIETSGAPTAAALLARTIRSRGQMSIVAWTQELALPGIVPLGLDVHGCWHWNHQQHAPDMWTTIRATTGAIDTLITHEFDLDDLTAAMDVQDTGACGKVFVLPFGAADLQAAA